MNDQSTPNKCPKCSSEMEKGYIWVTGAGARWAIEANKTVIKTLDVLSDQPHIISYKCKECGFLENFAE